MVMYEYKCKIIKIVDGDTVDVDIDLGFGIWIRNERIRLYGIDTPESRTRDKTEKRYGLYASAFLKNALGTDCILRTQKDRSGKFGRVLGEFIVFDHANDRYTSVKDIMIREHIGVEYYGQSKQEIEEQHLKNRELLTLPEGY